MRPVLLQVGGWEVPSYGVMLGAGALLLILLGVYSAGWSGLPRHRVALVLVLGYLAGLVGARSLYVLQRIPEASDVLGWLTSPAPAGFSLLGGLLFAMGACAFSIRWMRLPAGTLLDSVAVGLCLFGALGRLGCFLAGCCYGRPTSLPWGVIFPPGSNPALRFGLGVSVHPTQFYEAALLLGTALVLAVSAKALAHAGGRFLCVAVAYLSGRFFLEWTRGAAGHSWLRLTDSQWICLALFLLVLATWNAKRPWAPPGAGNPARPIGI